MKLVEYVLLISSNNSLYQLISKNVFSHVIYLVHSLTGDGYLYPTKNTRQKIIYHIRSVHRVLLCLINNAHM